MQSSSSLREYVRWRFVLLCAALILVGIVIELTSIESDTRHLVAGALIGAGVGAGVGELAWAGERRSLAGRFNELRAGILAQCRLAYRLGEFFYGFHQALLRGDRNDHHVREFLLRGEMLGIRMSIAEFVEQAPTVDYEELRNSVGIALQYVGEHLLAFFELGDHIFAVRTAGAAELTLLGVVLDKVADDLQEVSPFAGDDQLISAWQRLCVWWRAGIVDSSDAQLLVSQFHKYFLVLGGRGRALGHASREGEQLIANIAGTPEDANGNTISILVKETQAIKR